MSAKQKADALAERLERQERRMVEIAEAIEELRDGHAELVAQGTALYIERDALRMAIYDTRSALASARQSIEFEAQMVALLGQERGVA